MAWIEAHQELKQHPKVLFAADRLGIEPQQFIGHLFWLWWWALDFAPDGVIKPISKGPVGDEKLAQKEVEFLIANAAGWKKDVSKFVEILTENAFIDWENGNAFIHDWFDYCGSLVHKRLKRKDKIHKRSGRIAAAVRRPRGDRTAPESLPRGHKNTPYSTVPNSTVPNPTEPNPTEPNRTKEHPLPPQGGSPLGEVDEIFLAYCESWGKNPNTYKLTHQRAKWIKNAIEQKTKEGALCGVKNFRLDTFAERGKFNDLEYLFGKQKNIDRWCEVRLIQNTPTFQKALARKQEIDDTMEIVGLMLEGKEQDGPTKS